MTAEMNIEAACRNIFTNLSAHDWKVSDFMVGHYGDHTRMRFTFHCPCGRDIIETLAFDNFHSSRVPADVFIQHQTAVFNRELQFHIDNEDA